MSTFFLNNPLGANIAPIGFNKCNVDPLTIGLVGGSLLGGLFSTGVNQQNNEAQRQWQTRENQLSRDWQTAENQKQRDWTREQWNLENEYNTPLAQRRRLQEAGYNPWMSGSGSPQSTGASMSAPGMGSPSVGSAPSMSPIQNPFATLPQALGLSADIANQNADTISKASKAYTDYLKATGDYVGGQKLFKSLMRSVSGSDKYVSDLTNSLNQDFVSAKMENDKKALELRLFNLYGEDKAKKELKLMDKSISKASAEISYIKSQKNLSDQQIKESAQRTAKMLAETTTIDETRQYIVSLYEEQAKLMQNQSNTYLDSDNPVMKWFNTLTIALGRILSGTISIKP